MALSIPTPARNGHHNLTANKPKNPPYMERRSRPPRPPVRRTSPKTKPQTAARASTGLARVLSKMGVASRTEATRLIEAGRIAVNGRIVRDPEAPVRRESDRILLDGSPVQAAAKRYLVLNKPRGLVTTARDEQGRETIYACLPPELRDGWIAPVGRLDKASEGLIFLTNDTAWAQRILDPASHLPKVYHVQIDRHPSEAELNALCTGVTLEDGTRARAENVQVLRQGTKNTWLEITLHGGLNRQIRRMLAALGCGVLRLVRVSIGPVALGDLPKGQTRPLTEPELQAVAEALAEAGAGRVGAA